MTTGSIRLLGGALTVAGHDFGAPFGKLDIGDPGPSNIVILGNGTTGGLAALLYTLNSSGRQDLSFSVPLFVAGSSMAFQAAIFNPGIIVGLSNAVEVTFTP